MIFFLMNESNFVHVGNAREHWEMETAKEFLRKLSIDEQGPKFTRNLWQSGVTKELPGARDYRMSKFCFFFRYEKFKVWLISESSREVVLLLSR